MDQVSLFNSKRRDAESIEQICDLVRLPGDDRPGRALRTELPRIPGEDGWGVVHGIDSHFNEMKMRGVQLPLHFGEFRADDGALVLTAREDEADKAYLAADRG